MEYKTTKEECQNKIDKDNPIVCSCCGGGLEPIETVDNSRNPTFWRGCLECSRFDGGVSPSVYEIASKLVDERNFHYYSHMSKPLGTETEEYNYWRRGQISGATSIVLGVIYYLEQQEAPND